MNISHRVAGILLTLGLLILAGLDALLTSGPLLEELTATEEPTSEREPLVISQQSSSASARESDGPPLTDILIHHGMTFKETEEPALIRTVVAKDTATVTHYVLLHQGDRAGTLAWAETPTAKRSYLQLKEALHSMFSTSVSDLTDETQKRPGKPARDLLTFIEPNLTEERLVFLRVKNLLIEMHIAPGKDELMFGLLEKISQ